MNDDEFNKLYKKAIEEYEKQHPTNMKKIFKIVFIIALCSVAFIILLLVLKNTY